MAQQREADITGELGHIMMSWHHPNSKDSRLPSPSLTNMANPSDTTPGVSLSLPALQKRLLRCSFQIMPHPNTLWQECKGSQLPLGKDSPYFQNFLPSTHKSSFLLSTQICPSNKLSKIPPNGTLFSSRNLPLEYFSTPQRNFPPIPSFVSSLIPFSLRV